MPLLDNTRYYFNKFNAALEYCTPYLVVLTACSSVALGFVVFAMDGDEQAEVYNRIRKIETQLGQVQEKADNAYRKAMDADRKAEYVATDLAHSEKGIVLNTKKCTENKCCS